MTRDRSSTARRRAHRASQAEIDALGGVIAAAAVLADRARSDAAGVLLRRALAMVAERNVVPLQAANRDEPTIQT